VKFLVKIEVRIPRDLSPAARAELLEAERVRGNELKALGLIVDIWRLPGRLANVGIWSARDATELHEALVSLPVADYAEIDVTALAQHYLTKESEGDI